MKRPKLLTTFVVLLLFGVAVLAGAGTGAQKPTRAEAPAVDVAVAPVVRFTFGYPAIIEIDFQNTSNEPFRYLLGNNAKASDGGGIAFLEIVLRATPVRATGLSRRSRSRQHPTATIERVRELKPGEHVRIPVRLSEPHGNPSPGFYKAVARYRPNADIAKGLDLTPISFERTVVYVEIE